MRYLWVLLFCSYCYAEPALPEFTQRSPAAWINSPPLKAADFKGSVLLLDIWTFECWNCYRSFPWLNDLSARFAGKGLKVVGIHSPEFDRERAPAAVAAKAAEFGFKHPVMIDNDFAYWKALNNQYWPSFYLVDKRGVIRQRFVGETHQGDAQAQKIEAALNALLLERP
ncbi:redoxin family protein [Iodobacter sp. HSC-16F04]|uniref:Redoxin family protein n=1 Tax=Iodobacter violaceini TaxID=3044271 RepID=A0ABX0KPT8_9NEIS|nr:redoxin family protein [Iodobacter violacea]NHQ86543.1 redoxin family protein [Iodobacter violacea]